ncbi:4-hydroxy-tetrahydrodipicolinate synthase [Gordonia sp. HY442]|uniref:4-hydroxy-tetrahydrodipicolinate synthase n=1 Tax=Gordonia zhenghanii TaxID=2911516 RepID=UPI001F00D4FB|nr:4-hydroxy-tetrahydrodipicolinate synthase [Gordonia zhenghanii]MCF8606890.1 4-hydroxy-tetrahydrodipicolinate synthase [Gordonia zhenghanii]
MMLAPAAAHAFGTNLVAVPTPMNPDCSIDESGFKSMVKHLVKNKCDGIVVAGTTGESPTLSEDELAHLIRSAASKAKGRARIIAGVGTNDTMSTVRRARLAAAAGADALLVVTPYYSRPSQVGVATHLRAVADATDLPVMLYDVPHRTGLPLATSTLYDLAQHPNILAVKDATGDIAQAMAVMADCPMAYYCGTDGLNLPYLSAGATGVVSVVGAVRSAENAALIKAITDHDLPTAREINRDLIPAATALNSIATGGAVAAKVALRELGVIAHTTVRPPLTEATPDEAAQIVAALAIHAETPVRSA